MSSQIQFTAEQLAGARSKAWHQDGDSLLTLEAARTWVEGLGLVLFAPRAQQMGAPAPSLVEATQGKPMEAASAAESATARSFAARLAAEGTAVPLNLLGGAADVPDFLVSAKVFSYLFTMRGDKSWKQAPATSGANKVSTLALRVYETLLERGAMGAGELATELGREVTEPAILRALNELWAQLRVIPQLQQDDKSPTLWELTATRFGKAIKAGANAGQPTALSALLSLYLGQAFACTEEEAAAFLSPLTGRARVREVVHALVAQRQLQEAVVDGKTLVSIAGGLPEFPEVAAAETPDAAESATTGPELEGEGRIKRFAGRSDRAASNLRGKPAAGAARGSRFSKPDRAGGSRPPRAGERTDRERRPFQRSTEGGGEKPAYNKPWDEERKPRRSAGEEGDTARPRRSFGDKPSSGTGARKPYGERSAGASGRTYGKREGGTGGPRKSFGDRARSDGPGGFKPTRRSFGEGAEAGGSTDSRAPRGDRPSFPRREGGFKPAGRKPAFGARSAGPDQGGERPRRSFGDKPAFGGPRKSFGDRPGGERKSFAPRGGDAPRRFERPDRDAEGGERGRPEGRPSFGARTGGNPPARGGKSFGAKPFGAKPFGAKPFGAKPFGAKPFGSKPGGSKPFGAKGPGREGSFGPGAGEGGERPRRTFGAGRPGGRPGGGAGRPAGGGRPAFGGPRSGGAGRPGGKPGGFPKRSGAPSRRKPETEE